MSLKEKLEYEGYMQMKPKYKSPFMKTTVEKQQEYDSLPNLDKDKDSTRDKQNLVQIDYKESGEIEMLTS